jgi:hypothetical protein
MLLITSGAQGERCVTVCARAIRVLMSTLFAFSDQANSL